MATIGWSDFHYFPYYFKSAEYSLAVVPEPINLSSQTGISLDFPRVPAKTDFALDRLCLRKR
jgi:hypothetical protein